MRTRPELLQFGDVLADGGTVSSKNPVDHRTYVSVIVRYGNGTIQIRDFDKAESLDVQRLWSDPFALPPISPLEADHANRAADAYERDTLKL